MPLNRTRLLYVSLLALLLSGCSRSGPQRAESDAGPAEITLALNWFPEAEHGG